MIAEAKDGELVARCARGQKRAWEELVERYSRLVWSIPLRSGLSREDAADVYQATFTALVEHVETLRDGQCLAKWLITTAERESWRVAARRRREPALARTAGTYGDAATETTVEVVAPPDTAPPPEQVASRSMDRHLVLQALERLGGRCQQLLWHLYYDPKEPSYQEIGQRLTMAVGSIGPTRARCLGKLRQILQGMGLD